VPDLRDDDGWMVPAENSHPVVAVSQVMDVAAPDASADRISLLARLISQRGYTAAELAYAAQELPFDEYLNDKLRYGKSIMPADFERVIKQVRKKRSLLGKKLTEQKMEELVMELPDLKRSDFGVCSRNSKDDPIFILKAENRNKMEVPQ